MRIELSFKELLSKSASEWREYLKKFLRELVRVRILVVLLAGLIGIVGGMSAVAFRFLTETFEDWFTAIPDYLGWTFVILMPTLGGFLAGILVTRFAREAKGHGVPEVMEAVAIKNGEIRMRVPFVKMLASALTIGSGGSAGSEGPIAQISAGFGSIFGKVFKLNGRYTKLLVVCGVAAGISATFNAPIGGVLFGLEVIYGGIEAIAVIPVVLSSVVATAVSRIILGEQAIIRLTPFTLSNSWELVFFLILGFFLAFVSVFWIKIFYWIEGLFERIKVSPYVKPMLGGLGVGLVILVFPQVMGGGYHVMEDVFAGEIGLALLLILGLLKMVTTSLTLGSGGSGGVFAPSLFIGAMFGGAFGLAIHFLLFGRILGPFEPVFAYLDMVLGALGPLIHPYFGFDPMAYALVGMAALFAAAGRCPLTVIVMVMEMTNDYYLILPLMTACAASYVLSRAIMREDIYTLKLRRRGIDFVSQRRGDVLDITKVKDVMVTDVMTVTPNMTVFQVLELMEKHHHMGFPVLDKGKLVGVIDFDDVTQEMLNGRGGELVGDAAIKDYVTISPDETVHAALDKMIQHGVDRLIVTDPKDKSKMLGIITRTDILYLHEVKYLMKQKREALRKKLAKIAKLAEEEEL
ncbi:MAG: chloride channel protein [Candidatus Freyarchaeota archaeon]